jgi:uncharacterized protein YegL
MPILADSEVQTAQGFAFSAVPIDKLMAVAYTLVDLVVDISGSVRSYQDALVKAIDTVMASCRLSPMADNLLIRVSTFNGRVREFHGYLALADLPADYASVVADLGGTTALFEATEKALGAMTTYGKSLIDNQFSVNGVLVVITDGEDNMGGGTYTPQTVAVRMQEALRSENLESILSILVAVNAGGSARALDRFQKEAGFSQFIKIEDATAKELARLANFISQSISAQSQAVGTGGPSQPLNF